MVPTIKRPGRKLTTAKLGAVERRFAFTLPAAYRKFLLKHNGGTPDPPYVRRKGQRESSEVCRHFLGIGTGRQDDNLLSALDAMRDDGDGAPRMPRRLVPIAADPFGNLFCLSVAGRDAGRVLFWNHESETSQRRKRDGDVTDAAVSRVADSFDAFLSQFESREEDEEAIREEVARARAAPEVKAARRWNKLIEAGDVRGISAWLDDGGEIDAVSLDGHTPLTLAIRHGQPKVVDVLVDRGAGVAEGIEYAAAGQDWPMVKRLLQRASGKRIKLDRDTIDAVRAYCPDRALVAALVAAGGRR